MEVNKKYDGKGEDVHLSDTVCQVAPNVWAILTFEESWNSYINNYVIKKENSFLLVDTNLRKHRRFFQSALQELGVTPDNIIQICSTHRHPDHIGNVDLFSARVNWIHLEDYFELDDFSQTLFGHTFTGPGGIMGPLPFLQLPSHTPGSIALFDHESRVCFIGDHLHYYGEPLGECVVFGAELREKTLAYVKEWNQREPEKVSLFIKGLRSVMRWPIDVLATGHGPILKGEIGSFMKQIIQVVEDPD